MTQYSSSRIPRRDDKSVPLLIKTCHSMVKSLRATLIRFADCTRRAKLVHEWIKTHVRLLQFSEHSGL